MVYNYNTLSKVGIIGLQSIRAEIDVVLHKGVFGATNHKSTLYHKIDDV